MSVSRLRTVASASAATTAVLSFATISFGVPLGTHSPCQNENVDPRHTKLLAGRNVRCRKPAALCQHSIGLDLTAEHVRQRTRRLVEHQVDMTGDFVLNGGAATSIGHELEASAGRALEIDAAHLGRAAGPAGCGRCPTGDFPEPRDQSPVIV